MGFSALYLHIPFCRSKCRYCDFDSWALPCGREADAAIDTYCEGLHARIDAFGEAGALKGVETVYVGGGTPSLLGEGLAELVAHVREYVQPVEFTCEANPESLTPELTHRLAQEGVTRISLGVQSLIDSELKRIGRVHDAKTALAAVECVLGEGLDLSCDLMCGLPGQTMESWQYSLQTLLDKGLGHVSVYPLTLEEGTSLYEEAQTDPSLEPDEDFQADCMEAAAEALGVAGLSRYEVASYAKPGKACRHNIAYWTGPSYCGIGRSAAGMLSGAEARALARLFPEIPECADTDRLRYVQADDAARRFDYELLSAREAAAEDLMLACRTSCGIGPELIERASAHIPLKDILESCDKAIRLGLARWRVPNLGKTEEGQAWYPDATLVPTKQGWLLGNVLFELFWGLA